MNRCIVPTDLLQADTCSLEREAARHLQTVLRVKTGEELELFDGLGHTRNVRVSSVGKNGLSFNATSEIAFTAKKSPSITLFACISKGQRMDWTIEKAVEIGADKIVPVLSEHVIVKISKTDYAVKTERWRRIAAEAARQCSAVWLPEISEPHTLIDTVSLVKESTPTFIGALLPNTEKFSDALKRFQSAPPKAAWYVGPEGDFTSQELDTLIDAGAIPVSLGAHVLRAETACMVGLAAMAINWA